MKTINRLQKHEIFNGLEQNELEKIAQITITKNFDKDQIIFYETEEPKYFYLLNNGVAKVYKVDSKGNEIVLHNFAAPTMIAEMPSIENFKFPASCVAMDNCEFLLIKKEEFVNLLKTNPDISFHVIKSLTRKIRGMEGLLNRSLIFDATTKVAHYIVERTDDFIMKKNKEVANELNMTPETLSRVLKKLKDLNILDKDRNILNKDKLETFLDF